MLVEQVVAAVHPEHPEEVADPAVARGEVHPWPQAHTRSNIHASA